jgi:hypothetical protein
MRVAAVQVRTGTQYQSDNAMNKRQNQRLKMPLKARPNSSSPRWTSGRVLIQVLVSSCLLALFVAVAIPSVHLIRPSNTRSNNFADLKIVSEPTPTPLSATEPSPMPASPNVVYTGIVRTVSPANSTRSVTPGSSPALPPRLTVILNNTGSHSARRSKGDRKFAERERRNAERKRARLEAMYQSHLISSAAYKKGQDEYQSEITKYHSALNGTVSTIDDEDERTH